MATRKRTRSEELAFQAEDLALDTLIKPRRGPTQVISRPLKKLDGPLQTEVSNATKRTETEAPKMNLSNGNSKAIEVSATPQQTFSLQGHDERYTNVPINKDIPFLEDPNREDMFFAIEDWCKRPERHPKPLLVIGPPGCGKTFAILHYTKFHVEAYDDHDLNDFLYTTGLYKRPPAMFDCIENLEMNEKSALKKAIDAMKDTKIRMPRRLILTSEEAFVEPTKTWAKQCEVVKLEAPGPTFLRKCLTETWKQLWPKTWHAETSPEIVNAIQDACRFNVQACMSQLQFFAFRKSDTKDQSGGHIVGHTAGQSVGHTAGHTGLQVGSMDTFSDVPKMVHRYLYGTANHSELAFSASDVSFLAQMLQLNSLQNVRASTNAVDQTMSRWSFFDIVDRQIESDVLFTHMDLSAKLMPKVHPNSRLFLQWPKSLKPLERPTMGPDMLPTVEKN